MKKITLLTCLLSLNLSIFSQSQSTTFDYSSLSVVDPVNPYLYPHPNDTNRIINVNADSGAVKIYFENLDQYSNLTAPLDLDLTNNQYITIEAKASGPCNLQLYFRDVNSKSNNYEPVIKSLTTDFREYVFDFTGHLERTDPPYSNIDISQITLLEIKVNADFNGDVYIKKMIIGENAGATLPQSTYNDNFVDGTAPGWHYCGNEFDPPQYVGEVVNDNLVITANKDDNLYCEIRKNIDDLDLSSNPFMNIRMKAEPAATFRFYLKNTYGDNLTFDMEVGTVFQNIIVDLSDYIDPSLLTKVDFFKMTPNNGTEYIGVIEVDYLTFGIENQPDWQHSSETNSMYYLNKVGIGTDAPEYELDVIGTVKANKFMFNTGSNLFGFQSSGGPVTGINIDAELLNGPNTIITANNFFTTSGNFNDLVTKVNSIQEGGDIIVPADNNIKIGMDNSSTGSLKIYNSKEFYNTFADFKGNLYFRSEIGGGNSSLGLQKDGTVVIGTYSKYADEIIDTKGSKLYVNGSILCEKVTIEDDVPNSDYVFHKKYNLRPLEDVDRYIQKNKHLPEVPSAEEFKENGYSVGEMDDLLLRKVEELTLYMIRHEKEMETLKKEVKTLQKENEVLKKKLEVKIH